MANFTLLSNDTLLILSQKKSRFVLARFEPDSDEKLKFSHKLVRSNFSTKKS